MKINLNNLQHQLIISIKDDRFALIENRIRELPKQLISYREFPYSVTDKKTEINYVVNKIEGGVSFSFQKSQLIDHDPSLLIDSLKLKIEKHLQTMMIIFMRDGERKEIALQKLSYSPTDIEFSIQFGRMLNCQFYLSKIIGNSLMKKEEDFIRIYLIKSEILDGFSNCEYLKVPPLNLNLLVQQKDIWSMSELIYHTFLPSQMIQHMLIEFNCASSLIINQQYNFIPTKELGIFAFKLNNCNSNLHLFVSLSSKFVNNKLQIHLREAVQYSMLMGLQKIDVNKFFDELKFQRFEEFERINDFWDFLQKFFISTLAYTFFYETKFLQLQVFQKMKHLYFFQKLFIPIIQLIFQFRQTVRIQMNKDQHIDQRQIYQIIQNLNDKYLHIYFIRCIDDVPILSRLIKKYQEKIEEQIQRLKSINISYEHEINILASKLSNISIDLIPSDTLTFSLKIQSSQNGLLEYKFSQYYVVKKYLAQEKQWSTMEFPAQEELTILNSF